jgi:NTE family protein
MQSGLINKKQTRRRGLWTTVGKLSAVLWLAACTATPYIDEPLAQWSQAEDEGLVTKTVQGGRDNEILVMLAFSGGGARASAFAYGVLQELAATRIMTSKGERRLLDEVDIISSVSGGSFTNAYFALYGDRVFKDFEQRFLRVKIQSELEKGLFKHAGKLGSRTYGRSDMAADLYDEKIFDHKTFGDIKRPGVPFTIINSTDIASGSRIAFTARMFDLFCANLDRYPISRAVAASSAVPGAATPITLKNYAGQCGYEPAAWLQVPAISPASARATPEETIDYRKYLDASERPWVHLVDGGISDNLGLRPFYTVFNIEHNSEHVLKLLGHENVKQIIIVSVNAATHNYPEWGRDPNPPKIEHVLGSVTDVLMNRYTDDTTQIVRSSYERWTESRTRTGKPVAFNFVEVSFAQVQDPQQREQLDSIETRMQLEDPEVDRLIAAGHSILKSSSEYQQFLTRNSGSIAGGK